MMMPREENKINHRFCKERNENPLMIKNHAHDRTGDKNHTSRETNTTWTVAVIPLETSRLR